MADKKAPEPEAQISNKPSRKWNAGNIFWGLLLVLIGGLLLLHNLGVVNVNFTNLWALWPLLIIMAGVSLVAIRGWVGVVISTIVALAALSLVALVALDIVRPGDSATTKTDTTSIAHDSQATEKLNVKIEAGAAEITVGSSEQTSAVDASLTSSITRLSHSSHRSGNIQDVVLGMDNDAHWWNGRMKNDLSVTLTRTLPVDLNIDAGAVSINADLSQVKLQKLNIDSGASSIDIKLGNGSKITDVEYDIGMSSITLQVPRSSGVSLRLDSGLSGKDIPNLKEVTKDYYESDNYATATNKINVRGKMGMANLTVTYY